MPGYYDFKDIEIEEETEGQKRARRIVKIILGLLLVFLLIGFLIPYEIPASLLEGKRLQDNQLIVNDVTIIFAGNTYESLKSFYLKNQFSEVALCLTGEINNKEYIINSFYQPKTFFQTPISVNSQQCNKETIITMHTHPFKNCLFSQQDIISYNNYKKTNPNAITAIMCDTNRFAFYWI